MVNIPRELECTECSEAYQDSRYYVYNTLTKTAVHVECSRYIDPADVASGVLIITSYNERVKNEKEESK